MSKITVGVLRGGPSSEYQVSLNTGSAVLKHMPEKYRTRDILVSKEGQWHMDGFEKTPAEILQHVDVVFNAMHGEYGEDGKVQKILETFGTPYTGSDAFSSAVAMGKHLTKDIYERHKLKTPISYIVSRDEDARDVVAHLFKHFLLPAVVKPVAAGSSVGVTVVKNYQDMPAALEKAFALGDKVLIEEFIRGREATCGVVQDFRGEQLYKLLPIEIKPPAENPFFDYDAKYTGKTEEICPGNFTEEEAREIQRMAAEAHKMLGLRHYSRSDFIVTPRRGIYILETNTLPGLTTESLLPKSLAAIGCEFKDFLEHLVSLALRKK